MKIKKKRLVAAPPDTATIAAFTTETAPLRVPAVAEPQWWPRMLLTAALLSGIGLMIPVFSAGPLVLDEHGTYWLVGAENPGTLWQRSLGYENIPPLSPYLQRQLCQLFGTSEWSLRLLSMLSYWGAIVAVYFLGRELLGRMGGGLASLVLAWHPSVLGEIRIARCYGLALLLSSLAFWCTVRWSRKPLSLWAIPWAIANVALIWTHYLNAAVVLAQIVWLVWSFRHGSQHVWTLFAIGLGTVVAAGIPLIAPVVRIAAWGDTFNFQPELPVWQVVRPLWWLGLPAGWLAGRWLMTRSHWPCLALPSRSTLLLLFAWGLLPAILAAIVCRDDLSSLSNPRYRIGFAPASACLLVACLAYRRTAAVAVASVIVTLSVGWSVAPRWPWELKRLGFDADEEWRAMAQDVRERSRPGEPIFVQSGLGEGFMVPSNFDDSLFQDYVACRLGRFYVPEPHPRYGLPFLWRNADDMEAFYRDLVRKQAAAESPTVWVAAAIDTDLNRASLAGFERILVAEGYREVDRREHPTAVLVRYSPEATP